MRCQRRAAALVVGVAAYPFLQQARHAIRAAAIYSPIPQVGSRHDF